MNKQEFIEKFKNSGEWVKLLERPICYTIRHLIFTGETSKKFNKALGKKIPPIGDVVYKDFVFNPKYAIKNTSDAVLAMMNQDDKEIASIAKRCIATANTLHSYLKKQKSATPENLLMIKELYTGLTSFLMVVVFAEKMLEKKIEELVIEKLGAFDEKIYDSLSYIEKYNNNTQELIDILTLCKKAQEKNTEVSDKDIQKHTQKYGWLGTRWFFESAWSNAIIKNRITNYMKEDCSVLLKNVLEPKLSADRLTKEFSKKHNLTTKEKKLISVVKEFVYLRTFRTENLSYANYLMIPLMQSASEQLKLSFQDIQFASLDELSLALEHKLDVQPLIEERKKGYYMILLEDHIEVFTNKDMKIIDNTQIFTIKKPESKEIKGQIAWKGTATGKVRIVKSVTDLEKVNNGDIMVSVMTFPNFIPAMEKAAAFITDEGGILCHAAIISREMKKPCVIGTKTATVQLKDGDMVEVDANKGVVRKL